MGGCGKPCLAFCGLRWLMGQSLLVKMYGGRGIVYSFDSKLVQDN